MLRTLTLTSLATLVASSIAFSALAHNHSGDRDKSDYDIVKVAQSHDRFSTFVSALEAADMQDAFDKDGEYTVFAPTNDAFDALPEGTLESLLEDTDQLRDILSYHVIEGTVKSDDIGSEEMTVEALNGGELRVMSSYGNVMVNTATVTYADIEASNGVIHGIDSVLIPPADYAQR
jgi:uncharacterized surface protein with fasciclin (FAS1) repeats